MLQWINRNDSLHIRPLHCKQYIIIFIFAFIRHVAPIDIIFQIKFEIYISHLYETVIFT